MSKLIRSDDAILSALLKIQYINEIWQKDYEERFERE